MTPPVAPTSAGRISGRRERDALVFRGVPYARPPVGPLRYRKPLAPEAWEGVRPCESFGARSLQGSARRGQAPRVAHQSEDCLYLNLWTPALDDGARAVIVYVHGGGYVVGSGSEEFQDGTAFAADDVILVTFNHRLAALGFLDVDELFDGLQGTGNLGLHDTVRVLEWVQENIAAFGGDPDRVTLAGHSAGGVTTSALLGSKRAQGLFSRAIPISSASGHSWIEPDAATAVARRVLQTIGVAPGDREDLLGRPAEQLILSGELYNELYDVAGGHPFEPVLDGDLLEAPSIESIRAGAGADVPLLVGHMAEEFRLCVFDDQGEVRDPPLSMGVRADGFDHRSLTRPTGLPERTVLDVYRPRAGGERP